MRHMLLLLMFVSLSPFPLRAADWTLGYEGNEDWSHAFLTATQPVSRLGEGDLIAWGSLSYIRYDTFQQGQSRDVSAPGVGAGVMWRWSNRTSSFAVGPGYEVRWIDRGVGDRETEGGVTFRGAGHHWMGSSLLFTADGTYYDAIEWTAARSSLEYALGDGLRIGPEVAYQGNGEINVNEIGGILRYPISDVTSVWIRGGTARTDLGDGRTRDDPYFSAGIGYTIRR